MTSLETTDPLFPPTMHSAAVSTARVKSGSCWLWPCSGIERRGRQSKGNTQGLVPYCSPEPASKSRDRGRGWRRLAGRRSGRRGQAREPRPREKSHGAQRRDNLVRFRMVCDRFTTTRNKKGHASFRHAPLNSSAAATLKSVPLPQRQLVFIHHFKALGL